MSRDDLLDSGLSNISSLSSLGDNKPKERYINIPTDEIVMDDAQDRIIDVESDNFKRFCKSINESKGNKDPVDVVMLDDGTYRLVSGYTRVMACRVENILLVRAIVRQFVSEETLLLDRLSENSGRNDLNLVEAAAAYQSRLDAGISLDDIVIASTLKLATIKTRLAINSYPDAVKDLVRDNLVNNQTNLSKLKKIYDNDQAHFDSIRSKLEKGDSFLKAINTPIETTDNNQSIKEEEQKPIKEKNITLPYSVYAVLCKRAMRMKDKDFDSNSDDFKKKAQRLIEQIKQGKNE